MKRLSRWFRVYEDLVDDPKVQRLSPELFKALVNLWCLAARGDGNLPSVDDIAFSLRMKPPKVNNILGELRLAGLLDEDETGWTPHNWKERQFKSDISSERVRRYREGKSNSSETFQQRAQSQTQTQNQSSGADAPAAPAPRDFRAELFQRGLKSLVAITGKAPDSARSLIGKWLQAVQDEAIHVLAAIDDAERNRVADPVAWINRQLQPRAGPPRKKTTIQACDDWLEKFNAPLDRPTEIRNGTGSSPVGLLPQK
jgi:hypothetical protein